LAQDLPSLFKVPDKLIEQSSFWVSLERVKFLKLVFVLALLGLWLGAANHCRIENLPGLGFLVCSPHGETEPHQDNDCDEDSCERVENAPYKSEQVRITAPAPAMILAEAGLGFCPLHSDSLENFTYPPQSASVLQLPSGWQFSFRTALPPRAPSLLS
jgi:hypothetical protein